MTLLPTMGQQICVCVHRNCFLRMQQEPQQLPVLQEAELVWRDAEMIWTRILKTAWVSRQICLKRQHLASHLEVQGATHVKERGTAKKASAPVLQEVIETGISEVNPLLQRQRNQDGRRSGARTVRGGQDKACRCRSLGRCEEGGCGASLIVWWYYYLI